MSENGLWLVMHRDISDLLTVRDAPAVHVAIVLEPATGIVVGMSVGATVDEALHGALTRAATRPMGGGRPQPPRGLLVEGGGAELARAWPDLPAAGARRKGGGGARAAAGPPGPAGRGVDAEGGPPDVAARARRYGWPAGAELQPMFGVWGEEGMQALDAGAARSLTVALAAVLDHDG